ncbi:Subtilisin-like protease [Colletotrichum tanaceti]|uniref:Subtilisin-like protease n=1 Tax=Colletotrichum tanaceti TaxID=1306861 RepID=A0A4U6XJ52_9PEZI|nr:Subtilisin-like protease [Colletotrichum tanaceti]TKW55851.1 Subtilisin-like protease [Colletotrichum tanaceti]
MQTYAALVFLSFVFSADVISALPHDPLLSQPRQVINHKSYISPSSTAVPQYIIVPAPNNAESGDGSFESVQSRLSDPDEAGSELVPVKDGRDSNIKFSAAPLSRRKETGGLEEINVGGKTNSFRNSFRGDNVLAVNPEPSFRENDASSIPGPLPAILTDPLTLAKQPKKVVRQIGYNNTVVDGNYRPFELSLLSQEPRRPESYYQYDAAAGRGITVYILGSGMNLDSPDIEGAAGDKEFIYTPGAEETPTDEDAEFGFPDGTCMASKIFGPRYGVAKNANVTMVKVAERTGRMRIIRLTDMLTALAMVRNDVRRRGIQGKAVVSLTYTTRMKDKDAIQAYREILINMMNDDIVLVAPTGISNNNNGSEANNQYPAAFARDTALIAVNAVNTEGLRYNWSPGSVEDGATVAAPGTGTCAWIKQRFRVERRPSRWRPKFMRKKTRVAVGPDRPYYSDSVAAATVAGVAATLMAQEEYKEQLQVPGEVASRVKELIQGLAWERKRGGPPVVWNGIRSSNILYCRRGEDDSCSRRPTPVACINFDVNKYGYCCPGSGDSCEDSRGCRVTEDTGLVGVVPDGAVCPFY